MLRDRKISRSLEEVKLRTFGRLRRNSAYNGILERMNLQPRLHTEEAPKPRLKISEKTPKIGGRSKPQENFLRLPSLRPPLKISKQEDILKHIPSEGFVEFEIEGQERNPLLPCTVSRDGVILSFSDEVEFITLETLEKRNEKLRKLLSIPSIKNRRILRLFLQWKFYSKRKRFKMAKKTLQGNLRIDLLFHKAAIIGTLKGDLAQNADIHFLTVLRKSGFSFIKTSHKSKPLFHCFVDGLFQEGSAIMKKRCANKYEGIKEFKILARSAYYSYIEERVEYQKNLERHIQKVYKTQYKRMV